LLVSSHVLDEGRHCDELILLREGRIVAQLSPEELARRTGTEDLDEAFIRLIEST
jgi:ABC-2 type transport system ATP-binding protein